MRKPYKSFLLATLCCCLCALILTGGLISGGAAEQTSASDLFDYSLSALENKQSLSASEIFYRIYGVYPPDAEKEYLDTLSGITLRYTDLIPPSIVSTSYNGDQGTLDVTVPSYIYTASNGVAVEWIPETAILEGDEKSFSKSGEGYVCRFENLLYSKDFNIYVTFSWQAELGADAVDLLLTKSYADGVEALKIVEAYEETFLNPYLEALKKYEVYEAYRQALKDHAQYLLDLEQYEKKLEEYQAYLPAYESYLAKKAAYDAYLQNKADWDQYYAYQEFLLNDLQKYNEYLLYQAKVNKVLSKLAILESLFVSDSHNWTFYPSLMGSTVTSVTSRKDELITAGCNAADILNADNATASLRKLLTEYSELRKAEYASEHTKTAALYAYYTAHYIELRDEFALLYGSLISLYDNEFVVLYADKEGKLERFQQFIGQLYVTTTCLDDSEKGMRMENWQISGKSLSAVVEAINLIQDTGSSAPGDVVMPESEVERVEAVEPIEKPTITLSPVPKPTAPAEVKEPQKPTFVAEPDKENSPPVAEHPGAVPARPPMADALWNLALAIRAGEVPKREAEGISRSLVLRKTVSCPISIHNLKTVTFYDMDGTTVLYQQTVNYGESVTYGGGSLQKTDPYYVYYFRGWVLSDGSAASFDQVFENLSIFANYQTERRVYTVRWILDGVAADTYYHYGEMPKPPFSLEKPGGGDMMYRFTGWDKDVAAVTENAVYTGGFELIPRTYAVTWSFGEQKIVEQVKHGDLPVFPKSTPSYSDGVYYYEFLGWDKDLSLPVTGDRIFYAKYARKTLATAGNGASLEVTNDGKSITVLAGNSDVFIRYVAEYAISQELPLTIRWRHFSATYSQQSLARLINSACDKVDIDQRTASGGVAYTVSYQDAAGKDIGIKPGAVLSLYPMNEDGSGCQYSILENGAWVDLTETQKDIFGSVTLLIKESGRILAERNEFCNISALPLYAFSGQWVSLDLQCEFGYEIVGAVITKANGMRIEVEGTKFQMPVGDISIQLKVEKIVYHVTFMVDGKIYSQADYFLGEEIKLPQKPQKAQDDTYSYEFLEWSPTVTIAMGSNRNLSYQAVFSKNLLKGVDPYRSGNNNNRLLNTYLPIGLGVLAVGIGVLVYFKIRKKRFLTDAASARADDIEP